MSASAAEYRPLWDADAAGPVEVGIDVVEIDRIRRTLERYGERFVNRIFAPGERARFTGRPRDLATRFAAKEATMKALGTGISGVRWRDIEVLPNARGKPILVLHETALARARQLGLTHFAISLTHTHADAMAIVVATRGSGAAT